MTTYLGTAVNTIPGVEGDSAYGSTPGVLGRNTSTGYAVQGISSGSDGINGSASAAGYSGVAGLHNSGGTTGQGVFGGCDASSGSGVYGYGVTGTYGFSYSSTGAGVVGKADATTGTPYGVWGIKNGGGQWAGLFSGDLYVGGAITAGTKDFLIDHPLDPTQKDLRHSVVESSERKNIYDGMGSADAKGELVVDLPGYFEALNTGFRYQLTPIGGPAPNLHVKEEFHDGQFVVAGAAPGQRICWQITGNRQDALARSLPLVVEQDKSPEERGLYRYPAAHGQPEEKGVEFQRMKRLPSPPLSGSVPKSAGTSSP